MSMKARIALAFLLAGCLTAARAQDRQPTTPGTPADVDIDPRFPPITQTDATIQEQADAPPSDRPISSRRNQVSEPGPTLGDTGESLPEEQRWLQNSACIAGPAATAMPITAPDGCKACQRPGCGNGQFLHRLCLFFTYRGHLGCATQCCSACGYYHGAVPLYLYMRWPCRESGGCRPIEPPCQYPSTCFRRCKPAGCAFCGTHCPTR
jgi:hypothetical protein